MSIVRRRAWSLALSIALLGACGDDDGDPGPGDAAVDAAWTDAGDAAADGGVDPRFAPLHAALEHERVTLGAPGLAVAVVEGGEVTWSAGFGVKHPDGDDPVQPTTLFRIGSVTKMLTTVGLLQQVEAGRTTLDATLPEVLPDFGFNGDPSWAPSIRVVDLLTHGSAIADHVEIAATAPYQSDDGLSAYLTGVYGSVGYLMAPAGRFWNYTNPGFMLAGLVTERLTGDYYRVQLTDDVLAPLGMHRTLFLADEVLADGDYAFGATSHWDTGDPLVVGPESYDNPWARPAGFAWSSVLDLARFVAFLRDGAPAVLGDGSRAAMVAPQRDLETLLDLQHYGYGLFVMQGFFLGADFYDLTLIQHGGAINGYAADLFWIPELDVGLVTLASTDGAYFTQSLVVALQTLCELPPPATPPDLTVDPADFDRYVGSYDDPHNVGPIAVTLDGSDLRVALPVLDNASIPYDPLLVPATPHNFRLTVQGVPLQLTFILDATGEAEYFRTRYFVGTRVPVTPPLPAPPPSRPRLLRLLEQARRAPPPWRFLPRVP